MPNQLEILPPRQRRGSRARCILMTHGSSVAVAETLTRLVKPFAVVDAATHTWMPRGFEAPAEARLGDAALLLPKHHRRVLADWWLAVIRRANTPNWDIAATATIDDMEGVVLVEAKAHTTELGPDGHGIRNKENERRIREAVAEGNRGLNEVGGIWALNCDAHYQLANRFAWAWKLATLGVPVVLVYLGFLNASEMADRGDPFSSAESWEQTVRAHARKLVPDQIWGRRLAVDSTPVIPLIRSLDLPLAAPVNSSETGRNS